MYKYLLFLIPILTIACKPNVKVTPDTLPDAYVNRPYHADIKIINSAVDDMTFYSEFSKNSFKINPKVKEDGQKDYNNLIIEGLPKSSEPITVYISGNTYGTNFPGKTFKKTYTIKVHDKNMNN